MRIHRWAFWVFVFALTFSTCAAASRAAGKEKSEPEPRYVTIAFLENVTLDDLKAGRYIPKKYIEKGALGLVGSKKPFAVKNSLSSLYVTMGAGASAVGVEPDMKCRVYEPRDERAFLLMDCMPRLVALNRRHGLNAVPGLLGATMFRHKSQFSPLLRDMFDHMDKLKRPMVDTKGFPSVGFIANSNGSINQNLDGNNISSGFVYHLRLGDGKESEEILKGSFDYYQQYLEPHDDLFIIVMPDARARPVAPELGEKHLPQGDPLFPILIYGPGFHGGLLTSSTTRRPGLVSAVDIAPTILNSYRIDIPAAMTGAPIRAVPQKGDRLAALERMADGAALHDSMIGPAAVAATAWGYILIVGSLVLMRRGLQRSKLIANLMVTPAAALLFIYVHSVFSYAGPLLWTIELVVFTAAVTAVAILIGRGPAGGFAVIGAATLAVCLVDLFGGFRICADSYFGLSLLTGSRYYGIGNELLSCVIGASILAAGIIVRSAGVRRNAAIAAAALGFAALTAAVGLPAFGANLGGLLACSFGFTYTLMLFLGCRRFSVRFALSAAVAIAAAAALFTLSRHGGAPTHLAGLARAVSASGASALESVVRSKLDLHLALIHFILIRCVGIVPLAAFLLLLRTAWPRVSAALTLAPDVRNAAQGAIAAMCAAFLLNDTGITMLLLITYYLMSASLIFVFGGAAAEPAD